jgi:hypothetical protein
VPIIVVNAANAAVVAAGVGGDQAVPRHEGRLPEHVVSNLGRVAEPARLDDLAADRTQIGHHQRPAAVTTLTVCRFSRSGPATGSCAYTLSVLAARRPAVVTWTRERRPQRRRQAVGVRLKD